ncbi:MAG: leucine-rich repeat domain-containing protein [Eggerthellaceae bacterium]|nr:leucine-rich repeat domain-containing protein [Eggerthellaceae bacterium]
MNATKWTQLDTGERIAYDLVDGGALIVRCETSASEVAIPHVLDGYPVTGLADSSLSRLFTLKSLVLPNGLKSIGKDAFKSCVSLREVVLPETLKSVGSGAFRSTALKRLVIPATCTDIADDSFNLYGSYKTPPSTIRPSSLTSIVVKDGNTELAIEGGVLCRRHPNGLRAIACPNARQDVTLSGQIDSVSPPAFTGVEHMLTLRLSERLRPTTRDTVFPGNACDTLVIECNDSSVLSQSMPSEDVARKTLASLFRAQSVNIDQAISTFDNSLATVFDLPALSRAMLDRLTSRRFPSPGTEPRYRRRISASLDVICLEFATSNYWNGFDQLFQCGLLDESNVTQIIDVLSQFDETAAVGYLLQAKQQLFGKAGWDYAI